MIKHIAALTHQLLFCVLFCPWLWWFCDHCTKVDLRNLRYEKYQNGFTRSGCDPCHFQEMYIHVIYMACNKAHLFPEHLQEISELQLTSQSGTLAALKLWNSKRPSWHTRYNVTHKHIYMSFKYLPICNLYILYTKYANACRTASISKWSMASSSIQGTEIWRRIVAILRKQLQLLLCSTSRSAVPSASVMCDVQKTAFPQSVHTHMYIYKILCIYIDVKNMYIYVNICIYM